MTMGSEKLDAASEAGQYFRHMAQFVGFTEDDAAAIKESQLVIEKHIPNFVSQFYDHLLRYPPNPEVLHQEERQGRRSIS